MKNFKTIIALLLVLALTFMFAACGGGSSDNDNSGDSTPTDQSQEAEQNDDAESDDAEAEVDDDEIWSDEDLEDLDDMPEEDVDSEDDEDTEDVDEDTEEETEESEPVEAPKDLSGDYTGAFASNTDTALNLNVGWAANKDSDGEYDVTVQFYIDCYSIQVSERSGNTLEVKTGSETKSYSFKTKEVNRSDNTLEKVYIGETTIKLSADQLAEGAKVKATWDYKGSYSGKDLPEIVAEGEIKGN